MPRTTTLIIGGSAGIGLALARRFAADGHDLFLVARDGERLGAVAALLSAEAGVEVGYLVLDGFDGDAPAKLAAALKARDIRPAYLVMGLGRWGSGPGAAPDAVELAQLRMPNVAAPLALLEGLVPTIADGARILVIGSLAAFLPAAGRSPYAASKAELHARIPALRRDLVRRGIGVSLLAPGVVLTDFLPAAENSLWRRLLYILASRPQTVARAGYCGLKAAQALIVPGLVWRLVYGGLRTLPTPILVWLAGYMLAPLRSAPPGHDARPAVQGGS